MDIQVRYFAVLRERLGAKQETLSLEDGATSDAAMDHLSKRHPCIAELRPKLQLAINQTFIEGPVVLKAEDELALIPPVSGG